VFYGYRFGTGCIFFFRVLIGNTRPEKKIKDVRIRDWKNRETIPIGYSGHRKRQGNRSWRNGLEILEEISELIPKQSEFFHSLPNIRSSG
jgi:hypothetical protein